MVDIICPHCGFKKSVAKEKVPAGTPRIACPKCQHLFSIEVAPPGEAMFLEEPAVMTPPPTGSRAGDGDRLLRSQSPGSGIGQAEGAGSVGCSTPVERTSHHEKGVERFEKNVLFGIVRWFSLAMGALGLLVLVLGALMLFKSWTAMSEAKEVKVSYADVHEQIREEDRKGQPEAVTPVSATAEQTPAEVEKPTEVERMIKEIAGILVKDLGDRANPGPEEARANITRILKEKTAAVDERNQENFLASLKDVVRKSPAGEKPRYADTFMNAYLERNAAAKTEAETRKFEALKNVGTYAYLTVTGLLTAVSFGIILILAAIERNTRRRLEY